MHSRRAWRRLRPHYGTEKWIVPVMAARLHKLFPELPVYEWDRPEQGRIP